MNVISPIKKVTLLKLMTMAIMVMMIYSTVVSQTYGFDVDGESWTPPLRIK